MQVEENRNCNCNDNMQMTGMYMNNMPNMNTMANMNTNTMSNMNNMYNNSNNEEDCDEDRRINCEAKMGMLHKIMAYDFGITELALYLDTHSDDEKAICLHNRYCKEAKELKDKYQKVYGPLTIEYPCNKWRWLEEPWPWEERGNY